MTSVTIKVRAYSRSATVLVEGAAGLPPGGNPGDVVTKTLTGSAWLSPSGGGSQSAVKNAAQALSGHRVVYLVSENDVAYPDQSDYQQVKKILGITKGAALAGAPVEIQTAGVLVEPGWNFLPGDVWLGASGQLTQVVPASGNLVCVGSAVSPTALQIDIQFLTKL